MQNKIKVLLVDDSMLFRKVLRDGLSACKNINIVGEAANVVEAEKLIVQLKPDVVTMDIRMPGKSGLEFVKEYLSKNYVSFVLVSTLDLSVLDALAVGAVDFVQKPDMKSVSKDSFIKNLETKIYIASTAKPKSQAKKVAVTPCVMAPSSGTYAMTEHKDVVVALGASTGGTEATLQVLKQLPADIPPMVMVQHMPETFTEMYAQRLNKMCSMEVREAKNNDELRRGLVLLAPGNMHMEIVYELGKYVVRVFDGEKVSGHRPSVDVLFNSVARVMGNKSIGIILTGMGDDGARGLLQMKKSGAFTIGQDQESSVVYGMPKVAFDIGAVDVQGPCANIAGVLMRHLNSK